MTDQNPEPPSHENNERVDAVLAELVRENRKTARWLRFMPVMALAQLCIGAPAFIISIVVAWATFVQADATRKMQEASAWPRLETFINYGTSAEARTVAITLTNAGIGPALVESVRITLDGKVYNDFPAIAVDLNGGEWEGTMSQQAFGRRVIQAGERLEIVRLTGGSMRAAFGAALQEGRIGGEICYCSVYGSCWIDVSAQELSSVPACPDFGDEAFNRLPSPYLEPEGYLPDTVRAPGEVEPAGTTQGEEAEL